MFFTARAAAAAGLAGAGCLAATVTLAPAVSAAPTTATPSAIRYAYSFDTAAADTVVPNLQPTTGSSYDLRLSGAYRAAALGLPASMGGGTTAVRFTGTGTPGHAGGAGSQADAGAAPQPVTAGQALSIAVVFKTSLPTPIPATLPDSPNLVQSGPYAASSQVKVQIDNDGRAACRFKGSVNGLAGADPAVYSPAESPVVADNTWHTVICTKDADGSLGTSLTLTVDGISYTRTLAEVGDLDFTGYPLRVATNATADAESSDQFFGKVDGLVWAVAGTDTASRSAVTSYLPGLLTPDGG